MSAAASDGGVGAGVDEVLKRAISVDLLGDFQHVSCSVDVGAEQRRRIPEPAAGVDYAVIHVVTSGHRPPKDVVVPDVADESLDVEIVDARRVGTSRTMTRTS